MDAKATIRARIRQEKSSWTLQQVDDWSAAITARCLALPLLQAARSVFCYISIAGEVDTHPLITHFFRQGRTVAAPLILNRRMEAHVITGFADCAPAPKMFGIPAPTQLRPLAGVPDVTLVPGLAFTLRGERLGQGGGYYDRFLAANPTTVTVALAFDAQILDTLPTTARDQRVQWIVTPTCLIECAPSRVL